VTPVLPKLLTTNLSAVDPHGSVTTSLMFWGTLGIGQPRHPTTAKLGFDNRAHIDVPQERELPCKPSPFETALPASVDSP
jgi:hypothetical protein